MQSPKESSRIDIPYLTVDMTVDMTVSPLHTAASVGDIDAFNTIVKEVADLNQVNEKGETPLHVAAISGETTVGAYITECGGDVNLPDNNGNTPLHLAAMNNKRLFVSMLLWGEANVNATNSEGNTPLHEAAKRGFAQVAYMLLQDGGDSAKDLVNADGKTALTLAKESGDQKTIECIENPEAEF